MEPAEKCIFGVIVSSVIIVIIIGPFMLFSDLGGLITENPVLEANLAVSLMLSKIVFVNQTSHELISGITREEA